MKVLTIEQSDEWDAIVKTFKEYDVYYLSGYVKAFKKHGDGEPLLFYYSDDDCKGINVVMKRDISNIARFKNIIEPNLYFDFATPYGYGGWLVEGKINEKLFLDYEEWCCKHNIVSEFVRFHPVIDNYSYSTGFYNIVTLGDTVSIDVSNNENIWNNFSSKNRNVIRKALNNGIQIKQGFTEKLFNDFCKIYNGTMDKNHRQNNNKHPHYFYP
nr:aminoacyltransferase [Bacilli bacterium]